MNSHKEGEISLVIMHDPSKEEFVGFCYEFAIVKYGDDLLQLKKDLIEASRGYLATAHKTQVSATLLNRSTELPKDFQLLYDAITRHERHTQKNQPKLSKKIATAFRTGDAFLVPACV